MTANTVTNWAVTPTPNQGGATATNALSPLAPALP